MLRWVYLDPPEEPPPLFPPPPLLLPPERPPPPFPPVVLLEAPEPGSPPLVVTAPGFPPAPFWAMFHLHRLMMSGNVARPLAVPVANPCKPLITRAGCRPGEASEPRVALRGWRENQWEHF